MPISSALPTTLVFGHRGVDSRIIFVDKQEAAQDLLAGAWTDAANLFATQANALETNVNDKEASAVSAAQSAAAMELSSRGSANYKGEWTARGYLLGEGVSVSGIFWVCKLTHSTAQTPAVGAYWQANTNVTPTSYATAAVGGTVKARVSGTTLYLTINGTDA